MKKRLFFLLLFLAGASTVFGMEPNECEKGCFSDIPFNALANHTLPFLPITIKNKLFGVLLAHIIYNNMEPDKRASATYYKKNSNVRLLGKALVTSTRKRPLNFRISNLENSSSYPNGITVKPDRFWKNFEFIRDSGVHKFILCFVCHNPSTENMKKINSPKINQLTFMYSFPTVDEICMGKELKKNLKELCLVDGSSTRHTATFKLKDFIPELDTFKQLEIFETNLDLENQETLNKILESDKAKKVFSYLVIGYNLQLNKYTCEDIGNFTNLKKLMIESDVNGQVFAKIIKCEKLQKTLELLVFSRVSNCCETYETDSFYNFEKLTFFRIIGSNEGSEKKDWALLICQICKKVPNLEYIQFNLSWYFPNGYNYESKYNKISDTFCFNVTVPYTWDYTGCNYFKVNKVVDGKLEIKKIKFTLLSTH